MAEKYVLTDVSIDDDYIAAVVCPICGKRNYPGTMLDEGEILKLKCGHNFRFVKTVQELHLTSV